MTYQAKRMRIAWALTAACACAGMPFIDVMQQSVAMTYTALYVIGLIAMPLLTVMSMFREEDLRTSPAVIDDTMITTTGRAMHAPHRKLPTTRVRASSVA